MMSVSNGNNDIGLCDMEKLNEVVLGSEVAILTGGVDDNGTPLITFPTDAADLVDIYSTGDILHLLQLYVHLAGGKVSVLADLQHAWTKECITKLTNILHQLQVTLQHCISTVYLVKPRCRHKHKFLHREFSQKYGPSRMVPYYAVQRFESHEELYDYVERSQLTQDYGGTLRYDHAAWLDFHKTYRPVIHEAERLVKLLPEMKDEVKAIFKSFSEKGQQSNVNHNKEARTKYENILSQKNAREIQEKSKQSLVELETLHNDFVSKIHAVFLLNTYNKLRRLTCRINTELHDIDLYFVDYKIAGADIRERLRKCQENANEVKETITLLNEQVTDLPNIGQDINKAYSYRQEFIEEILKPSKEIISCSTVILKQLDTGKETTPESYATAFGIAKQLTKVLQPFTMEINKLNDTYTQVHLFFMLLIKVKHWKTKASRFLLKHCHEAILHNQINNKDCKPPVQNIEENQVKFDDDSDTLVTSESSLQNQTKMGENSPCSLSIFEYPEGWSKILTRFYHKHPPPRKRHLRLLTKNVPSGILANLRMDATNLVERTIFILALLDKNHYKLDDILLIYKWQKKSTHKRITVPMKTVHTEVVTVEVTAV